ncbi:MAG: hypothetical protein AAGG75_04300 [Bacteroidota bacterium]
MDTFPIPVFILSLFLHLIAYLFLLKRHWTVSGGDIAHWVLYALLGLVEIVVLMALSLLGVFAWSVFGEYMAGVFAATVLNVVVFITANYFRFRKK